MKVDVSNLKVLFRGSYRTNYLLEQTESDTELIRKVVSVYPDGSQIISWYIRQKFLCIGGPFAGTYQLEYDFDGNGLDSYFSYNRGSRSGPKTVLIWKELLNG